MSKRLTLGLVLLTSILTTSTPSAQIGAGTPAMADQGILQDPNAPQLLGGDAIPDLIVSPEGGVQPTRVLNGANGAELGAGLPFGPVGGGARMAAGDLNNDGVPDIVAGMGPGGSLVQLFDGATIAPLGSGFPFGSGFGGGVFLAVGDLNGDGRNDIAVGQGQGGGGLRVFNGIDYSVLLDSAPFGSGYGGGVTVAMGDLNADGRADLIVGQLNGGLVSVIDGATQGTIVSGAPFGGHTGGVHVAAGDVNGDGRADVILAPATRGGGVVVYDLQSVSQIGTFLPYGASFGSGVRVAAADVTGDGRADIITGPGPGGGAEVRVFSGAGFAQVLAVPAYGAGYAAGVFVAAPSPAALAFTSAASTTFVVGQAGSFTVRAVASPTASISMGGTLPSGVSFTDNGNGTATLAGTPAGPGGTFPLTFTATSGGRPPVTQSFTLTVQAAPAIGSAASTTFAIGAAGSFTVTSTGFPLPTLAVSGTLPAGVSFAPQGNGTALLSGTPQAGTSGNYPLTITASNGVGTAASQSFVLTVTGAPVFTSAASTAFLAGTPGTFQVTTVASPVATSITRTGTLPAGVNFTNNGNGTATIAGTPSAGSAGTYPLTLTASNGQGSPVVQNFQLTVNQAPAITSVNGTTFQTSSAGSFTVTTTGFPAPTLQATGALPAGVTFVNNANGTATLAGTPAVGTGGSYPLSISATNGVGSPAVQSFTLTVSSCAGSITPSSGALPAGTYNTAYSQSFGATGGTGYSFAVTSGQLPAGLALSTGGALTGSPTNTGLFTFSVTATPTTGCTVIGNYSLTVAPNAQNESFSNGVGNTQYSVGAGTPATPAVVVAGSVLTNDAGAGVLAAGPAVIASANGGQVAMNLNGSFLYTPPAAFAGPSDSFTYTLTDGNGATDTATVTINLSGLVWYVNAAAPGGDGRSHNPIASVAAALASVPAGQTIYVHQGSYPGDTTLRVSDVIRGAGAAFTLNGLSIPAAPNPQLIGTMTLADGVQVSGLTVSRAVVNGGSGNIAMGAVIANTGGRSVHVENHTGGTVTFSGAISDTADGILLQNNAGATIAFTGGITLDTFSTDAFTALGGGTITATQDNSTIVNTIATVEGVALRVQNTAIGAAGLTFRSINAGTGSQTPGAAIILDNTGVGAGNGGLTVTGNGPLPGGSPPGTPPTGGRIRRKQGTDGSTTDGVGIFLNSTKNPSFTWMELINFSNSAIIGREVHGFWMDNSLIDGAGNTTGINEGPMVFGLPAPSTVNGLVGSAVIRDTTIRSGVEHNVLLFNHSGSMTLQFQGTNPSPGDGTCFVGSNSPTGNGDGVRMLLDGTATGTLSVDQCVIRGNIAAGIRALATGASNLTVAMTNSVASSQGGLQGLVVSNQDDADLTATVTNSQFSAFPGPSIRIGQATGNASTLSMLRATLSGNTVTTPEGILASPVTISLSGTAGQTPAARLLIDGNMLWQDGIPPALLIETPDTGTSPLLDATVVNNHIDMLQIGTTVPDDPSFHGPIGMVMRASQGGANLCANISANTAHWNPTETTTPVPNDLEGGISVEQSGGTFRLERGVEPLGTAADVVLATANSSGVLPAGPSTTQVLGTVTVVENGSCLLPSAP